VRGGAERVGAQDLAVSGDHEGVVLGYLGGNVAYSGGLH
jgi:hypothetical protein